MIEQDDPVLIDGKERVEGNKLRFLPARAEEIWGKQEGRRGKPFL